MRRLFPLIMLCLTLGLGWCTLHGLFSSDGSGSVQPGGAILTMQQTSSDQRNINLLYSLKMADAPAEQPPQQFQVVIPKKDFERADRFGSYVSGSKREELAKEALALETQLFDERRRRLAEIENYINTSLAKNPEMVKLNVTETGLNVAIDRPKKSSKHATAETKQLAESQAKQTEDWINQTVDSYRNYVMGVSDDPNWLEPRLRGITALMPRFLFTVDAQMNYTAMQILPNYSGISQRSQNALYPLARALYEQAPAKDARSIADFALKFTQAMPTTTLRPRAIAARTSSSFTTPADCLMDNRCDPDAKVVFLATVLSILVPQTPIIMAQTSDDAYIGVALPASETDEVYTTQGVPFVMADPSSTSVVPFGTVPGQDATKPLYSKISKVTLFNTF